MRKSAKYFYQPLMKNLSVNHEIRIEKAILSLEGLSLGDSFGQNFFIEQDKAIQLINSRQLPTKPWLYTDDTVMAISIVETLKKFGKIEQDYLAQLFARRYTEEPFRGYGSNAGKILREISQGIHWKQASENAFSGMGSMGNGGAMRAAPLGAYFFDDYKKVVREAKASCEVTHSHHDAQAGTIAVAIAAPMIRFQLLYGWLLVTMTILVKQFGTRYLLWEIEILFALLLAVWLH